MNQNVEVLQNTADRVEETKYYVKLTPEELDQKREKLTENLINLDVENEAFELVKEEHKAKVKPLQAENAILITQVRTGQELRQGVIYHVANYDSGMMETFDSEGEMIGSRRLRPDEKKGQSKIFIPNHTKAAND